MLGYQYDGLAEHADNIQGSFEDEGLPVPAEIANRPTIAPQFRFYWTALKDLASERKAGGLRIPVVQMTEYADRFGVKRLDEFLDILSAVDGWLLEKARSVENGGQGNSADTGPDERRAASEASPWSDAGYPN